MKFNDFVDGVKWHMSNNIPLHESVYRFGSDKYFETFAEARKLYNEGKLQNLHEWDEELLRDTDLGKFVNVKGVGRVPLDMPISEEEHLRFEAENDEQLKGFDPRTAYAIKRLQAKYPHAQDLLSALLGDVEKNEKDSDTADESHEKRIADLEKKFADLIKKNELKEDVEYNGELHPSVDFTREDEDGEMNYCYDCNLISTTIGEVDTEYDETNVVCPRCGSNAYVVAGQEEIDQYASPIDEGGTLYDDDEEMTPEEEAFVDMVVDYYYGDDDERSSDYDYERMERAYDIAGGDPSDTVGRGNFLHREITQRLGLGEDINEAEYQGKKVELSKPKRGGSKKFYVYVMNPKTKKVKKVSFGAAGGGGNLAVKLKDPKARKAFADRHNCDQKNDKTKPGYWSCRLPRYAKSLGLSGGGTWW